jgi:periplasmic protein TonB
MKYSSRLVALALAFTAPVFADTKLEPPMALRTVSPEYPSELKRDGVAGVVVIKCTVDVQGNVVEPEVEKSSNVEFNQPAIDALKKWKFRPAQLDGAPVAKKISLQIKFVAES